MMKLISDLGETADGRQVLLPFKIDRMVLLCESDLASVELLINQHTELRGKKNGNKSAPETGMRRFCQLTANSKKYSEKRFSLLIKFY